MSGAQHTSRTYFASQPALQSCAPCLSPFLRPLERAKWVGAAPRPHGHKKRAGETSAGRYMVARGIPTIPIGSGKHSRVFNAPAALATPCRVATAKMGPEKKGRPLPKAKSKAKSRKPTTTKIG